MKLVYPANNIKGVRRNRYQNVLSKLPILTAHTYCPPECVDQRHQGHSTPKEDGPPELGKSRCPTRQEELIGKKRVEIINSISQVPLTKMQ